jgi:hypothetical protein
MIAPHDPAADPEEQQAEHEEPPASSERDEDGLEQHVGAVAHARNRRTRQQRRQAFVEQQQGYREQQAVARLAGGCQVLLQVHRRPPI